MITKTISLYDKPWQLKSQKEIPLDIFFDGIRDGRWQDEVSAVRVLPYKSEEQLEAKKKVTSVTISGKFTERKDGSIVHHSGYIGIDLDSVDNLNKTKKLLMNDDYVVAVFMSISGRGLCVVFRINPEKHRESFAGICEYLYEAYGIVSDSTSVNPSRARFVSFDPDIYVNDKARKFTKYSTKQKDPPRAEKIVYTSRDFEYIMQQIQERKVNMVENYHDWMRVGFALAEGFAEAGREYFHIVSQYSSKYDRQICDKQYSNCLQAKGGQKLGLATFYYYCKQAGVQLYTEETKKVIKTAVSGKRAGLKKAQVIENLKKFEGIEGVDEAVVEAAMNSEISLDDETIIDELESLLRQSHDFRRNEITRYVEDKGKILKQKDLNTIYIKAKKVLEKVTYDLVERLINSDFVVDYNPFVEFFKRHEQIREHGLIDEMFKCIKTADENYAVHFGRKWMVSMISSAYGQHSPLMYVLTGDKQYTGKTEFFRRLLPKELLGYYAESKLDAGKDDEILMTQKLLIMDDEMGGKSKRENKRLKELTSKQVFSLREPYGRNNVDLVRIAVLAGTTNELDVLNDPTGNRRIIPVQVFDIDNETYNKIDKLAAFMEAYWLWKDGFKWELTREDIKWLGQDALNFEVLNMEAELIMKYFEPCADNTAELRTATEVKVYLEDKSRQKLSIDKVGKELKRLKFEQVHVRSGGGTRRCWKVKHIMEYGETKEVIPLLDPDNTPF